METEPTRSALTGRGVGKACLKLVGKEGGKQDLSEAGWMR